MTQAAQALAQAAPFDALDAQERGRLDELGRVVAVAEGQIVWEQGADLAGAYILLEGSFFERRPDGVIVHSEPGLVVGIGGWLGTGASEHAAKSAGDTVLLELSRTAFEQLLDEGTRLGRVLLDLVTSALVGRVRELNETLNELVEYESSSPGER